MNAKLAKTLRQFSKYRMLPYDAVKKAWERSSKEEQVKTLPEIKNIIEMGRNAEKKLKEKQNDKKTNNQ